MMARRHDAVMREGDDVRADVEGREYLRRGQGRQAAQLTISDAGGARVEAIGHLLVLRIGQRNEEGVGDRFHADRC